MLPAEQLSIAMSILVFGQNLCAALFLTLGTAVFTNSLRNELASRAPTIPAEAVVAAGSSAAGVEALFTALGLEPGSEQRDTILVAYTDAIAKVFYVATGLAAFCFVIAYGLGWHDVRATKTKKATREEEKASEP